MKNFISDGKTFSFACTSPATPASGNAVRIGNLTGVAVGAEGDGGNAAGEATIYLDRGIFSLSVTDAVGGGIAIGDPLFLADGAPPAISNTSTGYYFGVALEAVGVGATTTIKVLKTESPAAGALGAGTVGTVNLANDAVTNDKIANMARGTVKVGGVGNAPTDLDANDSGKILVGDGTDLVSVAVSGDVALTSAGATTVKKLGVSPKGTVVAHAGDAAVAAADVPKIHTNTGAGGNVSLTLPAAGDASGLHMKIQATAAQTIRAVPAAGEKVYYGGDGVADKYAQLAGVIGNFMDLYSDGTDWLVVNANGVVTKQG